MQAPELKPPALERLRVCSYPPFLSANADTALKISNYCYRRGKPVFIFPLNSLHWDIDTYIKFMFVFSWCQTNTSCPNLSALHSLVFKLPLKPPALEG
jgi:hypothetical protein